jgi:hypothetical protein
MGFLALELVYAANAGIWSKSFLQVPDLHVKWSEYQNIIKCEFPWLGLLCIPHLAADKFCDELLDEAYFFLATL